MSGYYPPPQPYSRQEEKAELQYLTQRMQNYIGKVKKLREDSNQVDSSALLNSIRLLEDEVSNVKSMYDKELTNTRQQLQDESTAKALAETLAFRNNQATKDAQDRLSLEVQRNRALQSEIDDAHRLSAQKDMECQQLRAKCADLSKKVRDQEDDIGKLARQNEDTRRKLDREVVARQEAEDKHKALERKQEFENQLQQEESKEQQVRLSDDANRILQLEAKVRELARPDHDLHEALENMRRAAEKDLQKFKEESEATYHKNLQELKHQMDKDSENIQHLVNENKKLEKEINRLNGELSDTQCKLNHAEKQNEHTMNALRDEKEKAASHIRALEDNQRKLQDSLLEKMHEISQATNAKQPIRSELESLKNMLDEEEKRFNHIPSPVSLPSYPPAPVESRPRTEDGSRVYNDRDAIQPPIRSRPSSVPATMGQGRDYFDSIFQDMNRSGTIKTRVHPKSSPAQRTPPMSHDFTTATSSTTGDLKILEVNEDGKFVRLFNSSPGRDIDVGGFMIQQNVGGHPVAVYRFEPRTRFRAGAVVTVWSASSLAKHQPPTDFLWKEQHKWGTGPECTTILCKPNGHAIAWTTAAHRFSKTAKSYEENEDNKPMEKEEESDEGATNLHPEFEVEIDGKPVTVLKRDKQEPPSLSPPKHPYGQYSQHETHPGAGEPRFKTLGNDGSSLVRQSRSQVTRPDATPGELYTGHYGVSATRTGSAPLRLSSRPTSASQGSIRLSGRPSPFLPPHNQNDANVNLIASQQHVDFKPPMPKPAYAISSW